MFIVPGTTMIGQYRVLSQIGEGGMGAVYYGEHVVLGRPSAIKVLLHHIARDASLVQRFVNEARIASQMQHRNIVDVFDCGLFPAPDAPGAQWYIAMEFLNGQSLGSLIAKAGGAPIDPPTILQVLGEAANGLQAVHERHQIVHRDIKPDNLYLTQAEDDPLRVKILDFGIAKLNAQANGVQTNSQMAMGTPAYAAPEQLRDSKEVDVRADVWALGVIAHEMITGTRPWGPTVSVYEIIRQHEALRTAPDPRAFRPDTPPKLAKVISKAMEPDPTRRFPSPKAFAVALAEATDMPYSKNGISLLEKCAPELLRASNHSLTFGRPVPEELIANPPEIVTARERPAPLAPQPQTISDGIPRAPGSPRTVPIGEPARPISTLAASSGQAIAPAPQPRRRGVVYVAAGGVAVVGAVVLAIVLKSGSNDSGARAASAAVVIDAGAVRIDAPPAMSALAVITSPDGAEVFVDGVSKGAAPLNLQLPVGAHVELRAEAPGHSTASRAVAVGATPTTVKLDLAELPVAQPAVTPDAGKSPASSETKTSGETKGTSSHKRAGRGSGKGTGSGSDESFNPNDVL